MRCQRSRSHMNDAASTPLYAPATGLAMVTIGLPDASATLTSRACGKARRPDASSCAAKNEAPSSAVLGGDRIVLRPAEISSTRSRLLVWFRRRAATLPSRSMNTVAGFAKTGGLHVGRLRSISPSKGVSAKQATATRDCKTKPIVGRAYPNPKTLQAYSRARVDKARKSPYRHARRIPTIHRSTRTLAWHHPSHPMSPQLLLTLAT